ncbi:MAG: amidohydrolase [Rikenellaceae bacterium]
MSRILIKDAMILPMNVESTEPKYFKGALGIEGENIVFVAKQGDKIIDNFKADRVIDGTNKVVMPGLINAHTHVSMTLLRGYADDMPLMSWLNDKIWPFEALLCDEDIMVGARLGISEMLLGGTTCFVDMYYGENKIFDVVEGMGIRAMLSATLTDFNRAAFESDFSALMQKCETRANDKIGVFLSPHAPYTVSCENFSYVKHLSEKYNLPIHIHLSETESELEIIKEKYGLTPTEFLLREGILDCKTLAAHGVHLTDEDMEILRQKDVSVVHNPQSNMKLASGVAPVVALLEGGVNVALGTDGASSNNDLDMWEEMRSASFLQKVSTLDPCVLNAYDVLKMATVNGAKAIGRDDLGVLKHGNKADVILIDTFTAHLRPLHDVVASLVYSAKSTDVDMVIVGGEILVEDKKLKKVDLPELILQSERVVKNILKRGNFNKN